MVVAFTLEGNVATFAAFPSNVATPHEEGRMETEHEYYYGVDGVRYGPVSREALRALLSSGEVCPDDYIWDEARDDWFAISSYPELSADVAAAAGDAATAPADAAMLGYDATADHPRPLAFELDYVGFGTRLVAHVIDSFVLFAPVLLWFFAALALTPATLEEMSANPDFGNLLGSRTPSPNERQFMLVFWAGTFVIEWLYRGFMESSSAQATLGKQFLGIVVANTDGTRLTFGRASVRHVAKLVSQLTANVGYLLILFTPRRQGLHDLIADTIVVRRR